MLYQNYDELMKEKQEQILGFINELKDRAARCGEIFGLAHQIFDELWKELQEKNREIASLRERAERAEKFWGERQKEMAELASALQLEKQRASQIEAACVKKIILRPSFIVDAFCKILGITKEELLANSNLEWEEKLKRALSEECGKKK